MKKFLYLIIALFVVALLLSALVVAYWKGDSTDGLTLSDKVAIVYIEGPIFTSEPYIKELRKFEKNSSVKAIVLRVDSPGGAVAPSQEVYQEVKRIAKDKKVVVSMGSVAASGGYYIAAPSTRIVANPGTITGSIGVIMEIPNLEGLMDKVGIKSSVIKSGKHKDMGSALRTMTKEDRALLQGLIDDVYEQFLKDVSEARKIPVDRLRPLADGRVFSGRMAKEMGLVDELGGLEDAIKVSAKLAGIKGEPEVIRRREKDSLMELLKGRLSGRFEDMLPQIKLNYIFSP